MGYLDKIIEFLNNSNFGKTIKRESKLQKYFGSIRRSLYSDKPDEEILKDCLTKFSKYNLNQKDRFSSI